MCKVARLMAKVLQRFGRNLEIKLSRGLNFISLYLATNTTPEWPWSQIKNCISEGVDNHYFKFFFPSAKVVNRLQG